jgi:hypothetical protein
VALAAVALALLAPGFAAAFAPLLVLVALLLAGRFPGERIIERLAQRRRGRRYPRPVSVSSRRPVPVVRRVGRAVAFALAVRPPPAPLAVR